MNSDFQNLCIGNLRVSHLATVSIALLLLIMPGGCDSSSETAVSNVSGAETGVTEQDSTAQAQGTHSHDHGHSHNQSHSHHENHSHDHAHHANESTDDKNDNGMSDADLQTAIQSMMQLHRSEKFTEALEVSKQIRKARPNGVRLDLLHAKTSFAGGDPIASAEAYDRLIEYAPDAKPKFWQRGISLYYANRFADGVDQFNSHQTFNTQDVENSVWQLMCQAKTTSVEEARKQMISIEQDRRTGMDEIFKMFAGTGTPEQVLEACDYESGSEISKNNDLYHAFLYIGLYHEMMGETEKSNVAIDQALKAQPSNDSTMYWIARVHKQLRSSDTGHDTEPQDGSQKQ